jgi:predicted RNA-binding Zn-ribbon protein involved in translation (DUF1610 family)
VLPLGILPEQLKRSAKIPTYRKGQQMAFREDQRAAAIESYWRRQNDTLACPECGMSLPAKHTLQSRDYLLIATCPKCGTLNLRSALDDPLRETFRDLTADEWEGICQVFDLTQTATCPNDGNSMDAQWSVNGKWLLLRCDRCVRLFQKEYPNRR